MSRNKRPTPTTIYIACEGTNTERIYFEFISEQIQEEKIFAVKVYPDETDKNPKTNALNLVREAQNQIDSYDEVWVIFDKDGDTKLEEAFELAKKKINGKNVNIAFSSIAFENWFLLHFEKNRFAFPKSDCKDGDKSLYCGRDHHAENCAGDVCVAGYLREKNFIKDYTKRARNQGVYKIIKYLLEDADLLNKAIENSAWLRFKQRNNLANNPIHEINPYTDVDVLVKKLLNSSKNIKWAKLAETIDLEDADVTINLSEANLQVVISNKRNVSFISTQCAFSTIDSENNIVLCNIERRIIEPQNEETFSLCERTENLSLIKVEFENMICLVEI